MNIQNKLILFDVDGTLIKSTQLVKESMKKTLEEVFGTAGPIHNFVMSGKTDPQIMFELMEKGGIEKQRIKLKLPYACKVYERTIKESIDNYNIEPCPGINDLLNILNRDKRYILGLLTGNIEGIVALKLYKANINFEYFKIGAFGSDNLNRNKLIFIALRKLKKNLNKELFISNIILIGDTPRDILCAKSVGAKIISVASGSYSKDELEKYKPDYLFNNFEDFKYVYEQIKAL